MVVARSVHMWDIDDITGFQADLPPLQPGKDRDSFPSTCWTDDCPRDLAQLMGCCIEVRTPAEPINQPTTMKIRALAILFFLIPLTGFWNSLLGSYSADGLQAYSPSEGDPADSSGNGSDLTAFRPLDYDRGASNSVGEVASATAALAVRGEPPVIVVSPTARTAGRNETVTLTLEATGSGLSYQWYRGEKGDISDPVTDGTDATLVLSGLETTDLFWARITGAGGEYSDTDAIAVSVGRLANISTRGRTEGGENKMIAGFVLEGGNDLQLLLRVIGPTLGSFGVAGTAADPRIRLFRSLPQGGSEEVDVNDDWQSEIADDKAASAIRTGAFDLEDGGKDAVLLVMVPAGSYFPTPTLIRAGCCVLLRAVGRECGSTRFWRSWPREDRMALLSDCSVSVFGNVDLCCPALTKLTASMS